jgi:hypothetical protein
MHASINRAPADFFMQELKKLNIYVACQPGLPDGIFSNQNPDLGKFWTALQWKMLEYFRYGHLVYFMTIWYAYIFVDIWYI